EWRLAVLRCRGSLPFHHLIELEPFFFKRLDLFRKRYLLGMEALGLPRVGFVRQPCRYLLTRLVELRDLPLHPLQPFLGVAVGPRAGLTVLAVRGSRFAMGGRLGPKPRVDLLLD